MFITARLFVSPILTVFAGLLLVIGTGVLVWLATAGAIAVLVRKATVYPSERSSHQEPTPQGGGVAVVPVALIAAFGALAVSGALPSELTTHAIVVACGALALMIVGLIDDIRGLPIVTRLVVQALALGAIVATLPPDIRVIPGHFSFAAERALIFFGGLWFINLYNFMDGIDLMTVTETVTVTAGIVALAAFGFVPGWLGWVAATFVGAMLGFAPWNTPPARLFVGDAGSVAIGLIVGTLLLHVAGAQVFAAALILPLYYIMDATVTFIRRLVRVERFWEPHRDHFYQMAIRNGYATGEIVKWVALFDAALIALAIGAAAGRPQTVAVLLSPFIAVFFILFLLRKFSIPKH